MALIVSSATGNFNATATWVGGVVPTIGDEAQASTGHTVTITATTACDLVSNAGTGKFVLNSGVILTANVQHKGSTNATNCVEYSGTGANAKIIGNITGGSAFGRNAVNNTGAGTLEIQGNCVGGSDASAVVNSVGGSVIITGNLTGGSAGTAYALSNNQIGSVTISGNATGSAISAINNASTGSITLHGNVIGGTAAGSAGVRNASTATSVTITGTCTGGTNATASGIINVLTGRVTLNGSAIGGIGTNAGPGVQNSSTGNVFVTRAVGNGFGPGSTGISAAVGVANIGLGVVEIEALEYGTFGQSPTSGTGIRLKKANTNVAVFNYCDTAGGKTLIDATQNAAMPAASDVRSGVSYASGALIGSCEVPAASSVASGVPVANTTGTAVLTPAAIRAELATELARIDTTISSRLSPSGTLATVTTLTNAPTSVTPSDIWSHATRTLTAGAGISASDVWAYNSRTLTTSSGPTAVEIRQEIDANSTKLDATVSSRLASSAYTAPTTPPTAAQIATAVEGSLLNEADGQQVLNAIVGAIGNTNVSEISLVAAIRSDIERAGGKLDAVPTAAANASAVWGTATKQITGGTVDTLTNSPSVPSAASIAAATRTELAVELARVDAAVSSRMAASEVAKLDAVKVKTDALNTERLANVATTAIVGNLIAQANS